MAGSMVIFEVLGVGGQIGREISPSVFAIVMIFFVTDVLRASPFRGWHHDTISTRQVGRYSMRSRRVNDASGGRRPDHASPRGRAC